MTVGPTTGSVFRVEGATAAGETAIPLGVPIELRVVGATGDGRWLISLRGRTFAADASAPLVPGAPVLVVASRTDRVLELRVISESIRFDDDQYAAALLEHARSADTVAPEIRDVRSAIRRAAAAVSEPLTRPLAQALAALVDQTAPLRTNEAADALSDALARHVAALVPFEARLARGASDAAVSPDIRVLIGRLVRTLSALSDSERSVLEPMISDAAHSIVAAQMESASEWLREGTAVIRVPLEFPDGRALDATLRVYEREARTALDKPKPFRFDIRLTVPHLGALEACIAGRGRELIVQLFVEEASARPFIQAELGALRAGLQHAGFTRVSAECAVDSTRFVLPDATRPIPGPGTVLDARA